MLETAMLLFAHVGLALAAFSPFKRKSLGFVALGSMLPDLIDKPLGYLVFGSPSMGRTICHTLIFLLAILVIASVLRDVAAWSLAGGVLSHFILDAIWRSPVIFLWPLLGPFPPAEKLSIESYLEMLLNGLFNPWISIPELLGLGYVLLLLRWNWPLVCFRLRSCGSTIATRIMAFVGTRP